MNSLGESEGRMNQLLTACFALILVAAAVAKSGQVLPGANAGLLGSRTFGILLVQFELFLASWLLLGVQAIPAWRVSIATLLAFASVALWKSVSGADSCGCFGQIQVSPWLMLVVDLMLLCGLFAAPPLRSRARLGMKHVGLCFVAAGVAATLGFGMLNYSPSIMTTDGVVIGSGKTVILEVEHWEGQRLPLIPFIECEEDLSAGEWRVLLYRDDCPKCKAKLARLQKIRGGLKTLLVELPPYRLNRRALPDVVVYGRLNNDYDWFVETPVDFTLRDGNVKTVVGARARPPSSDSLTTSR